MRERFKEFEFFFKGGKRREKIQGKIGREESLYLDSHLKKITYHFPCIENRGN